MRCAAHQPDSARAGRNLPDLEVGGARIVATLTPRLAALVERSRPNDRREAWALDGTPIPTRDHGRAAKSKNDRWSCNAQLLIRRRDLRVIASVAGGPGNRNAPVHYRGSELEMLCKQHRRVLADGGYRGLPSSSRRCFVRTASCAIGHGDGIADVEPDSSTPSLASRIGVYCETIAVAGAT